MKSTIRRQLPLVTLLLNFPLSRNLSSSSFCCSQPLQHAIKSTITSKSYSLLPHLFSLPSQNPNPNPFSFLSTFPPYRRYFLIDEILQSLRSIRPRSLSLPVYSSLLSYSLHSPSPFPISLAIIQSTLRSGAQPPSSFLSTLSSAWIDYRRTKPSVSAVLYEMESVGYRIDCGTCNYVIECLCSFGQVEEAVRVLRGMSVAGCVPDSESYGVLIAGLCRLRRANEAVALVWEMVGRVGLCPRERSVVKVLVTLRMCKELWKAVDLVEFLEREGCCVGFGAYEVVVEGCVNCEEFVLGAKVAIKMTDRGFIPYITIRQKLVEGLAAAAKPWLLSWIRWADRSLLFSVKQRN